MKNPYATKFIQLFFLIIFFATITLLSWGQQFIYLEERSEMKIQAPKEYPILENNGDGLYILHNIGEYLDTNFPFQKTFTSAYYWLMVILFQENYTKDVDIGENGWLYLHRKFFINSYQHADVIPHIISKTYKNLLMLDGFAESHGAELIFLIPPNKSTIYTQNLPLYLQNAEIMSLNSFGDSLIEMNKDNNSPFQIIFPTEELIAQADNENLLYSKTGTHWTMSGSLIALHEVLKSINNTDQLTIWENMHFKEVQQEFVGDLANKIGVNYFSPVFVDEKINYSLLNSQAYEISEKEYCNGYHHYQIESQDLPRAVIVHDSFGNTIEDIYAEFFSDTVRIFGNAESCPNSGENLPEIFSEGAFDYLIVIMVERNLANQNSLISRLARQLSD